MKKNTPLFLAGISALSIPLQAIDLDESKTLYGSPDSLKEIVKSVDETKLLRLPLGEMSETWNKQKK